MGMCMSIVIVIHKALTYVFSSLNYQFMQKYIFVNCGLDALLLSYVINTKFGVAELSQLSFWALFVIFSLEVIFSKKERMLLF